MDTSSVVERTNGRREKQLFLHGDVRLTLGPPGRASDGRRSMSTRAHKSFAGSIGNINTVHRLSSTVHVEPGGSVSAAPRPSFNLSRPPGLDIGFRSLAASRPSLAFRRPSRWYRVSRDSKVAPASPPPVTDDPVTPIIPVAPRTDGNRNNQARPTRLPPLAAIPRSSENQVS